MRRLRIEWDCEWDPMKARLGGNEIARALKLLRGVSNISNVTVVGGEKAIVRPRLSLVCNQNIGGKGRCGHQWEADIFEDCPKCGQRRWVKKVEVSTVVVEEEAQPETAV